MLSKTIDSLSMSLVAYKEAGISLFQLLFQFIAGSFQPVLAYYGFFWVILLFKMDDVTYCFDLKINYKLFSCRFCYKVGQVLLEIGAALMYYKEEQVLLQSGADFWY